MTFSFWGYFDDPALDAMSRNESVFGDWNSTRIHFGTRWSVGMHWNINGVWGTLIPMTNIKFGWNHYALVYNSTDNQKLVYINNVLSYSSTTNGSIIIGDFKIGVATVLNEYYRGKMSNFSIYNRALSADEVNNSFAATRKRFIPYQFYNEGSRANLFLDNWSNKEITTMEQMGNLGYTTAHGYSGVAETYTFSLASLPKHSKIRYIVRWHMVDSLDTETSGLYTTSNTGTEINIVTFTKAYSTVPVFSITAVGTTTEWSGIVEYSYEPWNGINTTHQYGYSIIDTGYYEHTLDTFSARHVIGANQAKTDEAMYLSHVEVWLAP